jgi:predicted secreted protein
MSIFGGIVVYVITWWMVFFAVLPVGVRRNRSPQEGNDPGAPENARLWTKAAITTIVAGILTWLVWMALDQDWLSLSRPL